MTDLFGSRALELAISLSLFFLIASLICTAAREMLEAALKSRATDLERALREMFADPTGKGMTKAFFDHPIIAGLFKGEYLEPGWKWLGLRRNLPSYIPSGQFATALVDMIMRGSGEPYAAPPTGSPINLATLRTELNKISNETVKKALLVATDEVATLDEAKLRIEAWFNGSMDRASGWYKRRTQWILFWLGLLMAILLNLDTLTVTRRLFDDSDLRTAAVAAAEARVKAAADKGEKTPGSSTPELTPASSIADLQRDMRDIGFPVGWALNGKTPFPLAQARICIAPTKDSDRNKAEACDPQQATLTMPVPEGRVALVSLTSIILMPIGWLVTALGVTLGAPFWFDLLNKFIVIRSTIKPAQKSQDEASPEPTLANSPPGGDIVPGDKTTSSPSSVTASDDVEPFIINRWVTGSDPDRGIL